MSGSQNPQVFCVCVCVRMSSQENVLAHRMIFRTCVCWVSALVAYFHLCNPEILPWFYLLDSSVGCSDAEVESEETLEED